ncbi:tRNA (mnm(5)s(2)U34)-methyltransferase [Clostridium polynesiense]|uniref:tRNA (mnm(5)s(2)U34)-methyltransferase n=1 Tax=Clostridium polynesiense TaxID=1325933 RepID=UPI00058F47A1|nr:class I SAM-dependent methyltransferase [Clostridium polynesiense]
MFNYVGDISELSHHIIRNFCMNKNYAVDATLGNGYDTVFLYSLFKKITAFDIQQEAIESFKSNYGNNDTVDLICDSHSNIDKYIKEKADCIMYNLGYWPGGNKDITTMAYSTLESLKKALILLNSGGIISIAMYVGHNEGEKEEAFIMDFVENLPKNIYGVMLHKYLNRSKISPRLIIIEKK